MKKKLLLSLFLALALCLALSPAAFAGGSYYEHSWKAADYDGLDDAMDAAETYGYTKYQIILEGNIKVERNIKIRGAEVCFSGGSLQLENNAEIEILSGVPYNNTSAGSLILDNVTVEKLGTSGFSPLIDVQSGARLEINSSSLIATGCKYGIENYGGVEMNGGSIEGPGCEYGIFNNRKVEMNGGSIKGCDTGVYNSSDGRYYMYGGSIEDCGNGVANDGDFTMRGGSITDCSSTSGAGLLNYGKATINGGLIYGNSATSEGDDIYSSGGTLGLYTIPSDKLSACGHSIDGWYYDEAFSRWSCSGPARLAETNTFDSTVSLKAAHAAAPVAVSSVPATGDDSNVALWTGLLLFFSAAAIATRKKKA